MGHAKADKYRTLFSHRLVLWFSVICLFYLLPFASYLQVLPEVFLPRHLSPSNSVASLVKTLFSHVTMAPDNMEASRPKITIQALLDLTVMVIDFSLRPWLWPWSQLGFGLVSCPFRMTVRG